MVWYAKRERVSLSYIASLSAAQLSEKKIWLWAGYSHIHTRNQRGSSGYL
jgi:hypothetical protein